MEILIGLMIVVLVMTLLGVAGYKWGNIAQVRDNRGEWTVQ
jgi:Tfp pilus assembly protein PilX